MHNNTLLDAIVVDKNDISKVFLTKFYFSWYHKYEGITAFIPNIGISELETRLFMDHVFYNEFGRVVGLLIIIQEYIFPTQEYSVYDEYKRSIAENKFSSTGSERFKAMLLSWCGNQNSVEKTRPQEMEYKTILCKYYIKSFKEHISFDFIIEELQNITLANK